MNIQLSAGNYWIGFNPTGTFAASGQAYSIYCPVNSAGATFGDVWINPGGGEGIGSNYVTLAAHGGFSNPQYGSIDLQGSPAPEPMSATVLAIGSLALLRKKPRTR